MAGQAQASRLRERDWPRAYPACSVPASRAKLTMLNTVSKIRGQVKNPGYPQSEGLLGECMIRHGKELGGESNFGEAAGGHFPAAAEFSVGTSEDRSVGRRATATGRPALQPQPMPGKPVLAAGACLTPVLASSRLLGLRIRP